jgi:hypothetical protein
MNTEIFEEWFHESFVPSVEFKNIKVVFLPANKTSLIQPQDQGIIASVKKRLKAEVLKMYFQSYLANHPDPRPLHTFYDKYTIKDVIYLLASIWKSTPVTTLKRAWHNLNINIEVVDPVVEPNLPYQNIIPRTEIQSWLQTEEGDGGFEIFDDAAIIERVRNPEQVGEQVEEDDGIEDNQSPVTASEMNKAVLLCNQLSDLIQRAGGSEHIQAMFDMQAFLRNKQFEITTHQSTIEDFIG